MSYPVVYIGLLLACSFAVLSGFQQSPCGHHVAIVRPFHSSCMIAIQVLCGHHMAFI
ncbi:hypothetical protein FA15DRAFT_385164 [Coprinopsis marcescibilis]|uniref:Uncharacterized protein n=1 Tax=Coprinopsis marcescibilis TaxID=230819 RepID=A0A5C3K9W1_COPMA|nr:hypothetical protein FA15DRAFT_385164 [Coprinopsis marcescibilis]